MLVLDLLPSVDIKMPMKIFAIFDHLIVLIISRGRGAVGLAVEQEMRGPGPITSLNNEPLSCDQSSTPQYLHSS